VPAVEDDGVDDTDFGAFGGDGQAHLGEQLHLTQRLKQGGLPAGVRARQHRHAVAGRRGVGPLDVQRVVADGVGHGLDAVGVGQREVAGALDRDGVAVDEGRPLEVVGQREAGQRHREREVTDGRHCIVDGRPGVLEGLAQVRSDGFLPLLDGTP